MAKKDFRKVAQEQPRYPKPSVLTPSALGKLGLAALGGLLLGGATGIPQACAEEAKSADSAKSAGVKPGQGGAKKGKPAKGAAETKAVPREPRFMPNGGKPAHRMVEVGDSPAPSDKKAPPAKPDHAKHAGKNGTGTDTSTDTAVPIRPRGVIRAARMEEESPPPGERDSTAGKTDVKKEPEFLPPPGAPPLPRNPEPPTPKKSK
jgi:hypothetical protein